MLFYHDIHSKVTLSPVSLDQRVLTVFEGRLLTIREIVLALGLGNSSNHPAVRDALGRLIETGQVETVLWNGARRYRRLRHRRS